MKHTASPGKKGKKGKKSGKRKGLRGFMDTMKSEAAKPLGVVTGIIIGTVTANGVNYLVGVDENSPAWKKLAGSAVTTGAGVAVSYFGRNNDFVKHTGYGMTGAGVYKGVRVFVTDDLFANMGFKPLGETPGSGSADAIVEETKKEIQKLLAQNQPGSESEPVGGYSEKQLEEVVL